MIRQRALAWATVLALVVALQIASLPIRPFPAVAASLAQDSPEDEAGQPTDLAVVALYCAAAPTAEALTSFFAIGTAPAGCAPAVGVSIAVMENEGPLAGSPFTTDTSGTIGVRVGLGSSVTLREDPKSLPDGYEPLTREANGVPYANPVQLDSAAAGTAALFVNVPTSVAATLNQGNPAVDAGEPTDLVAAVTPNRTGCDPAYPDARTCIPPGSPLDAPCSITDERNFTVLPPDPRDLDADGDGIGCEPISSGGGTNDSGATVRLYDSVAPLPVAPASSGILSAAASPDRIDGGVWVLPPYRNRAGHWLARGDRNRANDWIVRGDRSNNGSLAIVSNTVIIGNGLWRWAGHRRHDNGFWLNRITIGNFTIARSSNGSLAIVSNPVFVGKGLWTWGGHHREDNWLAPDGATRVHAPDVELLAINGGLAVESPPTTLEQSSNTEQPTQTLNGALSVALPADPVAPPSDTSVESPPDTAVAAQPSDAVEASPSDLVESPPSDAAVQPPPDADVAPAPSDISVAPPPDDGYLAPAPSDSYVEPPSDNSVQPPPPDAAVALPPDAAVAPPSDGYVEPPPSDIGALDPVNVDTGVDPGNVMPDPIIVGPGNGDSGNGDFVNTAPDPVTVAPSNDAPDLGLAPGGGDFGNGAPDPVSVAPGNGDSGVDPGNGNAVNVMPDPGNVAPDPIGFGPGNGDSGIESGGELGGEDG